MTINEVLDYLANCKPDCKYCGRREIKTRKCAMYGCKFAKARMIAYDIVNNQDKWIPVSERLPENDGDYLVTIFEGTHEVDVATWEQGRWLWFGDDVTAWAYRPQPYGKENKENGDE